MNNKLNISNDKLETIIIKVCQRYVTHKFLDFENFSTDFGQIGSHFGFKLSPENVREVYKIYETLIQNGVIKGEKYEFWTNQNK